MLEVKNLKKVYRSKKGVVTKALDDVSLTFPETGMIFILGKSGSGKSTLLNVCGGLDRMDSGEIIIKGKSSKDFSAQDFDSYRNTFVGFVFQEYNILDEFTVEQNIALALELQNKKRDKDVIAQILADVEMTDFAQRKPNTLSGGQKQRVAIARALVKAPEIIMADEPTGALDSKTGQQVFDTLKKLSQNKLVIVISHDRDFAEQYGDRIIELKDGKILSDQTRATEGDKSKNVRFYGTDTVCVSNGADLTDADLISIKTFLEKSGGSAVISTSREKIAQFKEDRPEISVGTFENIKEQPQSKQYEKPKMIRSHLPVRHAVKMGASGLKTKPVRLVFTVLLSVIAFILFGLASTLMLFDGHEVRVKTFTDSDINYISLGKKYRITEKYEGQDPYSYFENTRFNDDDFNKIVKDYGNAIAGVRYSRSISNVSLSANASMFYSSQIEGVVVADDKLKLLAGRLPESTDEVAITDFLFDAFKSSGTKFVYGENNEQLTIGEYGDIFYSASKPVVLRTDAADYKIVGVFKGMTLPKDFQSLKAAADDNERPDSGGFGMYTWQIERDDGLYSYLAVSPELFESIKRDKLSGQSINLDRYFDSSGEPFVLSYVGETADDREIYRFAEYKGRTLKTYGLDGAEITAVNDGEIAVGYKALAHYYEIAFRDFMQTLQESDYVQYLWDKRSELEQNYTVPYPAQADFIDRAQYDAALVQWENDKDEFLATHPDTTEDEYERFTPKPDALDYVDENAYKAAEDKYYSDKDNYIEEALIEFRKDGAHVRVARERAAAAEAKFRAENPEPADKYSDEYYEWSGMLNDVVRLSDPMENLNAISNGYYAGNEKFEILNIVHSIFVEMDLDMSFSIGSDTEPSSEVKLVGYFDATSDSIAYVGSDLYSKFYKDYGSSSSSSNTKYDFPADAYIDKIFVSYDGSKERIEQLITLSEKVAKDDSKISICNSVYIQLDSVIETASVMEFGFMVAGGVLALFAFLLMFNFISASITAKKKDIGILRAIGARTTDVFKIFISEAFIIALICFAISAAGTFGLCILLNSIILENIGISMSLFVFGPLSLLCVLGIAFVTALIATIIPVAIYSRKPPISSIRAL